MSRRSLFVILMLGAALAGCERAEAPVPTEEEAAGDEAPRLTPVDEPAAPQEPVLGAISRADLEAELEAGAGCHAEQDGKNLLTVVEGDAIAKPYGTLRHFDYDGDLETIHDGGRFNAGAVTITVAPEEGEGELVGEVRMRRAEITFSEEGQETRTLATTWHCGS